MKSPAAATGTAEWGPVRPPEYAAQVMRHWGEESAGEAHKMTPNLKAADDRVVATVPGLLSDSSDGANLRSPEKPHSDGGPALKAESSAWDFDAPWRAIGGGPAMSAIANGIHEPAGAEIAGNLAPVLRQSASDVADSGFADSGHELPHRREMENSFGMDFSSVRAHSGGAAQAANQRLHSYAYAMGNQVAFKSATPEPALVAHELTHVLQQSGGSAPATKRDGGVDTSGEAEADAVEAAVRAGQPARTALKSASAAVGPARKGQRPARHGDGDGDSDSRFKKKFGSSMSFSKDKFEQSYSWKVLELKGETIPLPIPGLFILLDAGATVKGGAGLEYGGSNRGNGFMNLGLEGSAGFGLGGGIPDVAMGYGMVEGKVTGAFQLNSKTEGEGAEGGAHADASHQRGEHGHAGDWNLQGTISAVGSGKIGVGLGPNRMIDKSYEWGNLDIFKISHVYFDARGLHMEKLSFEWSKEIQAMKGQLALLDARIRQLGAKAPRATDAVGGPKGRAADVTKDIG